MSWYTTFFIHWFHLNIKIFWNMQCITRACILIHLLHILSVEMSSEKAESFYRLFQFSCNTSVKVTRAFTKWNVLNNFENSFEKFLEAHKHAIYHLWCNTVKCCQCSNFQLTIRSSLGKENFIKLYNISKNNTKGHFIIRQSKVVQHCVCHVSVNTQCSLNTLDITMLYTLLTLT